MGPFYLAIPTTTRVHFAWPPPILGRYALPDRLCGGNPLYHGEIDGYQIGASVVFPEAGMVPCVVLQGFLGVEADTHCLRICPQLPGILPDVGITGLVYCGNKLSIKTNKVEHGYQVSVFMIDENPDHSLYCEGQIIKKKYSPFIRSLGRGESLRLYVIE